MTNWIKIRADEIRGAELARKNENERKTNAANELKGQLAPFWKALCDMMQDCVKDFNLEFPEASRVIDQFETPAADCFIIRRTTYPLVMVKAQLNNAGTLVQYTIARTQRKGMNAVEKQASFGYAVSAGDPGYADASIRTHEDAAKLLLDP